MKTKGQKWISGQTIRVNRLGGSKIDALAFHGNGAGFSPALSDAFDGVLSVLLAKGVTLEKADNDLGRERTRICFEGKTLAVISTLAHSGANENQVLLVRESLSDLVGISPAVRRMNSVVAVILGAFSKQQTTLDLWEFTPAAKKEEVVLKCAMRLLDSCVQKKRFAYVVTNAGRSELLAFRPKEAELAEAVTVVVGKIDERLCEYHPII